MRRGGSAALVGLAVLMSSCGMEPVSVPGAETSSTARASSAPAPASSSRTSVDGELDADPLDRDVRAGDLRISITYTPTKPVRTWTREGVKAVEVTVTVHGAGKPKQKVYLTRATLQPAVRDVDGELPALDPVVDTAHLLPGYLVAFPSSYQQVFALPPVDTSAVSLSLGFKYEFATLVDDKARDYTKQTASDAVQVDLSS